MIMDHKLTLKMDKAVIEAAKKYAKDRNTSLSRLIESYLASLVKERSEALDETAISPLVRSLSGVITLEDDHDLRKEYTEYLDKKYK